MNERTIRITGTGRKQYRPDQIIVTINYDEVLPTHEKAMESSVIYTATVKEKAASVGIDPSSVKTSSFDISRKTKSYYDSNDIHREKFLGYEAKIHFKITIPLDNHLLSQLLFAFKDHEGDIHFGYGLSDREKASEEVLGIAVENASKKARILADASQVKLGRILTIDYSFEKVDFEFHSHPFSLIGSADCQDVPEIDVDPEDIDIEDHVTIVWEIE